MTCDADSIFFFISHLSWCMFISQALEFTRPGCHEYVNEVTFRTKRHIVGFFLFRGTKADSDSLGPFTKKQNITARTFKRKRRQIIYPTHIETGKMKYHNLLSAAVVVFLSILHVEVTTAKDGLRRRIAAAAAPISPKSNVQLTVANRMHPKQLAVDSGIGVDFEARIIGGQEADPLEYPYFTDLGGCGAALIAPNVILSAGEVFA